MFQEEVEIRGQKASLRKVLEENKTWHWVFFPCESEQDCQKIVENDPIFFQEQEYFIKKI